MIDTTGFGGINVEQSSKFDVDAFIIEDPVAEDNDPLLKDKNNIDERLNVVKSPNKAIIKTEGINTKTSGTMTLTIGAFNKCLKICLEKEGSRFIVLVKWAFLKRSSSKKKILTNSLNSVNVNAL